ncbi:hypothetical protein GBAR_LOCUS28483, partial [Geodia barretti]
GCTKQSGNSQLNRVLSSVGELTIASIVRCQAGTYTCVTAPPNPEDPSYQHLR